MATLRAPGGPGAADGAGQPGLLSTPGLAQAGGLPPSAGGASGARSLRRMTRAVTANRKATVGTLLLVFFCLVAAFPGVIAHDDPNAEIYPRLLGLSGRHLLGTTALGQDMFPRWCTVLGRCC